MVVTLTGKDRKNTDFFTGIDRACPERSRRNGQDKGDKEDFLKTSCSSCASLLINSFILLILCIPV